MDQPGCRCFSTGRPAGGSSGRKLTPGEGHQAGPARGNGKVSVGVEHMEPQGEPSGLQLSRHFRPPIPKKKGGGAATGNRFTPIQEDNVDGQVRLIPCMWGLTLVGDDYAMRNREFVTLTSAPTASRLLV